MKLFISQAKTPASTFALALHRWIPEVTLNGVETWCAADIESLYQGSDYYRRILDAADSCDACLAVITRESIKAWWLNFETGFFFGQKKTVYGLLCGDVTYQHLASANHPLAVAAVNFTQMTQESLAGLLITIERNDPTSRGNRTEVLRRQVEMNFDSLKRQYDSIFGKNYLMMSDLMAQTNGDIDLE